MAFKTIIMKQHGGKREGAGRKPGTSKVNMTFSIDIEIANKKPKSNLVNQLLKDHFNSKINTFTS